MTRPVYWILLLAGVILGWCAMDYARAATLPPKPLGLVSDFTNTLSKIEKYNLEKKLEVIQPKAQFVVAVVDTLDGEEISQYAGDLFRLWGVGKKGENRGLLLIVAKKERKVRFEVGYGLEPVFTDSQSKDVIRKMGPSLSAGNYFTAFTIAADEIAKVAQKD
jgi:uncharacterized protein